MRHDFVLFRRKEKKAWYFYYYEDGKRKFISTGQTVKIRAEQAAKQFLDDTGQDDRAGPILLRDYAKDFFLWGRCSWIKRQYAKGRPFSEAVADGRRAHLINYILPTFGVRPLDSINRIEIENWLISLPLANQTKNHILYSFSIILRDAALAGKIPVNPLEGAEPMGKNAKPRDVFTVEELRLLFPQELEQVMKIWGYIQNAALFMILATTGLRSGEVRALRWECILEDYTALLIREAVKTDRHNTIAGTKSGDHRVVLLPGRAAELLRDWHVQTPYGNAADLIFYGRGPEIPLNRRTLCYWLADAVDRAGSIPQASRELTPHCFRHTYNSLMKNILPENVLRQLVGHKSERMTANYDHPGKEDLLLRVQGAKEIINNFWN